MEAVDIESLMANQEAFGELYRQFHPRILGLCSYLLDSREEAEEASNEVFTRLPRALKSYDRTLSFPRWLTSVAGNYCIDLLRRRRSERRVVAPAHPGLPEPAAGVKSPLDELLSREQQESVRAAMARLPSRYRTPLVLRYYDELTYDEIAAKLGTTRANAATLLFRAKQQLRALLNVKEPAEASRCVPKRAWAAAPAQ